MHIKKNIFHALAYGLIIISSWCRSDDFIKLTPGKYDKNSPLIIDAVTKEVNLEVIDYSGYLFVVIKNMVPSHKNQYKINIDKSTISVPPFDKTPVSTTNNGISAIEESTINQTSCKDTIIEAQKKLDAIESEIDIKNFMKSVKKDYLETNRKCDDKIIADTYKSMQEKTSYSFKILVEKHKKYTLVISKEENEINKVSIQGTNSKWQSHFGFTFADNINKAYYSKQADDMTYTIEEQEDVNSFLYSATALFTYPLFHDGANIDVGITTGVGASNESIFLYFGPSITIRENFLMTIGAVMQEVDVLNGVYSEGQFIGESPIDSKTLTTTTYKPSFGISFGYKFAN